MEQLVDLKFNGALSFLNDHLDGSSNYYDNNDATQTLEKPPVKIYKQEKVTLEQPKETLQNFDETTKASNNKVFEKVKTQTVDNFIPKETEFKFDDRLSNLEEMILNSGRDLERFNEMKIALLEMEKEKIIMKYKEELIMMILNF